MPPPEKMFADGVGKQVLAMERPKICLCPCKNGWRLPERRAASAGGARANPPANSIPVRVRLERASGLDANVVCLLLRKDGQVRPERRQVQACNLLVELLGQKVHLVLVALLLRCQEVDLSQHLVGEGARHHE